MSLRIAQNILRWKCYLLTLPKLIGDTDTPARKINVDVVNQVVTLRGKVGSASERLEAERIAKETDGVKRVVNLLKVVVS